MLLVVLAAAVRLGEATRVPVRARGDGVRGAARRAHGAGKPNTSYVIFHTVQASGRSTAPLSLSRSLRSELE